MLGLDATRTLEVWEAAAAAPLSRRTIALLAAAGTGTADELARLPLGRRDALLLQLHGATFGDRLDGLADCPSCGTAVELTLACAELLSGVPEAEAEPTMLEVAGWALHWRPPDSEDMAAAAACPDAGEGSALLLARCVRDAKSPAGEPVAPPELPEHVVVALADAIVKADPLAEVIVELVCPQCTDAWEASLQIGAFVWARLQAAGQRLLRDVDALARAYGWTEAEILALPPGRRAAYLALVGHDG
jgi:hypothetical protein